MTNELWTPELRDSAQQQGWDLFTTASGLRVSTINDEGRIKDDDHACAHVRQAALLGDQPAITALFVLAQDNPVEAIEVMAERGVFSGPDGATSASFDLIEQYRDSEGDPGYDQIIDALSILLDRLGIGEYLDYFLSCYFSGHVEGRQPLPSHTAYDDEGEEIC